MKNFLFLAVILITSCGVKTPEASRQLTEADYRPAYHYTPKANWMNDPNGMVYYDGEYHLFYQYYPEDNVWGPMHWGHAISTDLVHWDDLAIALYPDELGYIFSGSAVVDKDNTSGLKNGDEDVLISIFTHHSMEKESAGTNDHQCQSIAYSNDKGRTWVKYANNPVIPNDELIKDFRDPKVMWHETSKQWIMTLAAGQRIKFYTSPNLIDWTFASDFGMELGAHGGVWECPDLFQMQVEGTDEKQWVLFVSINPGGPNGGSATQYFVGDFDGKTFTTPQKETQWLDMGTDNYAGVTWSNAPDGRHIFLGWMSNWKYAQEVPTETWRSGMTLPRELVLQHAKGEGYLLRNFPTQEVNALEADIVYTTTKATNKVSLTNSVELANAQFHLTTTINMVNSNTVALTYGNDSAQVSIAYDAAKGLFTIDRSQSGYDFNNVHDNIMIAPYMLFTNKELTLDIWVDKTSIELFVNQGECVMTHLFFAEKSFDNLDLMVDGDEAITSFEIVNLQ